MKTFRTYIAALAFKLWKKPQREASFKPLEQLVCGHCETMNVVAECKGCGQSYVMTTAHIEGRARDSSAGSLAHEQFILVSWTCDGCLAEFLPGKAEAERQQQRTCPTCHNEFLSQHNR